MIRSKFLQQIKYQKTAGTAFAKGGAGSALVIAIGGTSSTAIKLQHCDTASGKRHRRRRTGGYRGAKEYLKVTGATTSAVVLGDFGEDAPDSSVVL